jgi:hypothetical protein
MTPCFAKTNGLRRKPGPYQQVFIAPSGAML